MATSGPHLSILKTLRADCGVQDLSLDAEKTIAAMDARYSFSSSKVALTALRKEYPANKEFIEEIQDRGVKWKAATENQTATETQVEKYISWDNIIQFRDMYYDEMDGTQRILLALYTYVAPVRLDYTPMKIVTRKPKKLADGFNYLVNSASPYFLFHCYKTHKLYGDKKIVIPAALKKELGMWIQEGQQYLFEDAGVPWSESRLSQNMVRIFKQFHGMNTGVTMLRHAYATKFHAGQLPLAALKKTAEAMMHSPMQSMTYRFLEFD